MIQDLCQQNTCTNTQNFQTFPPRILFVSIAPSFNCSESSNSLEFTFLLTFISASSLEKSDFSPDRSLFSSEISFSKWTSQYFFNLIPFQRMPHSKRNLLNIPLLHKNHNFFKNALSPSTIIEWNKLELGKAESWLFLRLIS